MSDKRKQKKHDSSMFAAIGAARNNLSKLAKQHPHSHQPKDVKRPVSADKRVEATLGAIADIANTYGASISSVTAAPAIAPVIGQAIAPIAISLSIRSKSAIYTTAFPASSIGRRIGYLSPFKVVQLAGNGQTYVEFQHIPTQFRNVESYPFSANVATLLRHLKLDGAAPIASYADTIKANIVGILKGTRATADIDDDVWFNYAEIQSWEAILLHYRSASGGPNFVYIRLILAMLLSIDNVMRSHPFAAINPANAHVAMLLGGFTGCIAGICQYVDGVSGDQPFSNKYMSPIMQIMDN
jgi:hypothetical protein